MGFRANRHPTPDWVPAPLLQAPGPKHHYHLQHFFPHALLSQGLGPRAFGFLRPRSGLSLSRSKAPGLRHPLWRVPPSHSAPSRPAPHRAAPRSEGRAYLTVGARRAHAQQQQRQQQQGQRPGPGREGVRGHGGTGTVGTGGRARTLGSSGCPARSEPPPALPARRAPRGPARRSPPHAPSRASGGRSQGGRGHPAPPGGLAAGPLCHWAAIQSASLQGHKKGSYPEPAGAAGAVRAARIPRTSEMRDLGRVSSPL